MSAVRRLRRGRSARPPLRGAERGARGFPRVALRSTRGHHRAPRWGEGRLVAAGAMLLEVMLALAIFVAAGTAILSLVNGTLVGMERTGLMEKAADRARSAMAEMEAGLATPQTLNGPVEAEGGGETGWELEVDTEPSRFSGLTRVTVRAWKRSAPGSEREAASYTLRQLVRLGGKGEERVGGEDDLAEEARRGLRDERRVSPREGQR